jgi:NAD(P)-dependent dehydrogenase (short-subunit alcohol dehydrogenase family)
MKIAIITGASRGLGKTAALHAAQRGIGVIATYNSNAAEAAQVVAEIEKLGGKAVAIKLDATKSASFAEFASEVQKNLKQKWAAEKFDFLVNNAGFGLYAPIEATTEEQFDQLMAVHLKGPFFLTQKLLPLMNDKGRIINLSTGLTRFSFPGYGAYAMMKGGVEVFTRYLAKELGARGITVNTLAPGAIETDFGGGGVRDNPEVNKMIASLTNLGRAGVPDDIGPLIASLLSEDARWVNAQRIEASGGMLS